MRSIALSGLDGSNPLGFLAALGTLRGLSQAWKDKDVALSWQDAGHWHAVLHSAEVSQSDIVNSLYEEIQSVKLHPSLAMADNLNMLGRDFRLHLLQQMKLGEKEKVDKPTALASAFGCDGIVDEKGVIADTALRTMSGAGHQHFLKTMREVLQAVSPEQIENALFLPWTYSDPLQGLGMRFDPMDDNRYALRWSDPSGDSTRGKRGNMLGANALAILGIPLLATVPCRGRLETVGFQGHRSHDTFWTWPLWNIPLSLEVVRSALSLSELVTLEQDRANLLRRGIVAVYRSQRLTVGKFRNFTPAQAI